MSEFFKPLEHHKQYFLKHGQEVVYKKGQYLVMPSEVSQWVFFLEQGCVCASFTFNDGVDRLIGYFIPGMTFAQSGSFFEDTGGGLEYSACEVSRVRRMPRKDFLEQLENDQGFNADYVELLLRNQIYLVDRIIYQGEKGMYAKSVRWLLFMAKYYGKTSKNGVTLMVPVTQEAAANFMHSTRESASTAISKLKKKGLITVTKKMITIPDLMKLEAELV